MLTKLNHSIYYLPHNDENERPTLGLVCGDRYSLVIDGGNSAQHAKDFLLEIEKLDIPPVKYMVITHAHWDHFLGMNEFDATVIVNSLTNEKMKAWQEYSFDDRSLQQYLDKGLLNDLAVKIIQKDIPTRESFKLNAPDIIFEKSLMIDLGNKICLLESIPSTHTADSTIVYIPDEKVIFLGDSAYGTTTNSLFHYKKSLLIPMIEEIQKYEPEMFLLGHESICDKAEMDLYWKELTVTSQVVESTSLENALSSFKDKYKRDPNDNELFFIKAFVNDQKI